MDENERRVMDRMALDVSVDIHKVLRPYTNEQKAYMLSCLIYYLSPSLRETFYVEGEDGES